MNFNIFKPRCNSSDLSVLNTLTNGVEYIPTTDNTLLKVYTDKQKFDWDLYVLLYCQEYNYKIVPEVKKIRYLDSGQGSMSIELDINELCSLRTFLTKFPKSRCHLVINELMSFLRYLKVIKIQTNNLSLDTLFVNNTTSKFYLIDTISITFGDYLDTGVQMLNISIQDSDMSKELKGYFRKQLGASGESVLFENVVNSVLDMYS